MNLLISCPICHGQGAITITDVVDGALTSHHALPCPLCGGQGVLKKPARRAFSCR